jgi:hypothetical protein
MKMSKEVKVALIGIIGALIGAVALIVAAAIPFLFPNPPRPTPNPSTPSVSATAQTNANQISATNTALVQATAIAQDNATATAQVISPNATPIPSIPRLHPSHTGTLTLVSNGQQYTLTISNLTEKPDGSFTGISGLCVAFLGSIESDGSINFIDKPYSSIPACGKVYYPFGTFSGKLYPDGSIMGDWQGTSSTGSQTSGYWKLL